MATKTLSDFIKNYIKNLGISGTPQPFEDYKASLGDNYDGAYASAVAAALAKKRRSQSAYGTTAEGLSDRGLARSGYQEHLSRLSAERYEDTLSSLEERRKVAEDKALSGYAAYLSDYAKREGELRNTVKDHLLERNVLDTETAYGYAINAGLSERDARSISESIYSINRQKMIKQIIEKVMTLRLNETTTELYARAAGLNDEDIAYVTELAGEFFNYFDSSSDEYFDKIEDLENIANGK